MSTPTLHYPFSRIFVGKERTICISGSTITILESSTGKVLDSSNKTNYSGSLIRGVDVTSDFSKLVISDDAKQLKVWRIGPSDQEASAVTLTLDSSRELLKKSSEVHFTVDASTVLASDKFGDIYRYSCDPSSEPTSLHEDGEDTNETSEKNSDLVPILGHTSVVTSFLLSPDNRYVITGDRDEHVRVSWYPLGYNIETFCLGHRKYISSLHIPSFDTSILVSGGGDPHLIVWQWVLGKSLTKIPVYDVAQPLIKIRGGRRAYHRIPRKPDGQGLSRKSKRGKKKKGAVDEDQDVEMTPAPEDLDEAPAPQLVDDQVGQASKDAAIYNAGGLFDPDGDSFVIGKIGSVVTGEPEPQNMVVFSVVGASGLFYFPLFAPYTTGPPEVKFVDLGAPIIDFCTSTTVASAQTGSELWVSLDGEWQKRLTPYKESTPSTKMATLVSWASGEPVEIDSTSDVPLLHALNTAALIPATAAQLNALELYMSLATLPKSREEEAEGEPAGGEDNGSSAKAPTKDDRKKADRTRTREELLRKLHTQSNVGVATPPVSLGDDSRLPSEDREVKKSRVD